MVKTNIVIIGAAGHVGLPYAIHCASQPGISVYGVDIDQSKIRDLNKGKVPFYEPGMQDGLVNRLNAGRLEFGEWDWEKISKADYIFIMIGTPYDPHGKNDHDDIFQIADRLNRYSEELSVKAIVLRSTVKPGSTDHFEERLKVDGKFSKVIVAFAPERIAEGQAFEEMKKFYQLVGYAKNSNSVGSSKSTDFLMILERLNGKVHRFSTAIESEVAKLITNMWRYVSFGVANEFQIYCDYFGVNAHDIFTWAKEGYPRLAGLPMPGPNVGGPCLSKDGYFLLPDKFKQEFEGSFINHAYKVNEYSIIKFIQKKIKEIDSLRTSDIRNIIILGETFKANSDDTRGSISYILNDYLENSGYNVTFYDPYTDNNRFDETILNDTDLFVVMTPHRKIRQLIRSKEWKSKTKDTSYMLDLWGIFKNDPYSNEIESLNYIFLVKDIEGSS